MSVCMRGLVSPAWRAELETPCLTAKDPTWNSNGMAMGACAVMSPSSGCRSIFSATHPGLKKSTSQSYQTANSMDGRRCCRMVILTAIERSMG